MTELRDLSPEQQKVVETWGQGLAVMAGAGSGKTTTLVIKCAELLKRKSTARFAAVSFTERSASDLRVKLTERLQGALQGEGSALSGHWVMTIHGLCGTIIREYPREAGFDGDETMLAESEAQLLWERALDALFLDELPADTGAALETLLDRESRNSVFDLIRRVRDLAGFGALSVLASSTNVDTQALEKVSRFVLDRYDRLKRRRGALDFNDLERGADRALEYQTVREAFQRRFDLVLVDEFQDTNPLQAKIILRFARPDVSNLCVVGDPKQSIYRFRDADVTVFEEFCSRLPVNLSLTWNFRSRPGIIHFTNQLCEKSFAESQMRYDALIPKREASEGEGTKNNDDSVVRLDVQTPADLARWVQGEVARGIPLEDIALLMRKIRGGNEKWIKALTAAGIPIAIGSGGLYWQDSRVREMVALLKWWANPANTLSAAVFFRAPWVGIADAKIDEWARPLVPLRASNETSKAAPEFERGFFESDHPLARALVPLRGRVIRPGEVLLALLIDDAREDELGAPLLGLWHRCEDLSSRGLDFGRVVAELTLALENERRERDVPPPKNMGQLSILTLHSSKGLEFPHVVLVDLGKKSRAGDSPTLFWDREKGAYLIKRDEDGGRDRKDPIGEDWRAFEKGRELAESKRVFYVALTRARERLILVCPELIEKDAVFDPEKSYSEDFWRSWVECSGYDVTKIVNDEVPRPVVSRSGAAEVARVAEVKRSVGFSRSSHIARLRRPRHSVSEWSLLSRCERAYEWKYIRPPTQNAESGSSARPSQSFVDSLADLDRLDEDEVSQRELGTRVHALLERRDLDGLRALEKRVGSERFSADSVIEWASHSDEMADDMSPTEDSNSGSVREIWTELAFEIPIGDEILVGSVDRLVRLGDTYSLIDFKVTAKPKTPSALLEAYQIQMELYGWALKQLEPKMDSNALRVSLINISSREITTVPVTLMGLDLESLARRASWIIDGRSGVPTPGTLCRMCEFRSGCAEGSAQNAL